jgi:hypothetical protein
VIFLTVPSWLYPDMLCKSETATALSVLRISKFWIALAGISIRARQIVREFYLRQ